MLRLPGRNYRDWIRASADVRERYDYLYSDRELEPWVDRIRTVGQDAEETCVVTNNHILGQSAVNALQIAALLSSYKVAPLKTLVERYP